MKRFVFGVAALSLICTTTEAQETGHIDVGVVKQALFADWPKMIRPAREGAVDIRLGNVVAGDAILEIPFVYTHPIRLTAAIKGEWVGLEAMPVGELGFDAGQFTYGGMYCFFKGNAYVYPTCYGAHPFRKNRATEVIITSNVPLSYTYTTAQSSIYKAPQVEPLDTTFDHDFKLSLSLGKWNKEGLTLLWLSEGGLVTSKTVALLPDGTAQIAVGNEILRFEPNENNKNSAVISLMPLSK